MDDDTDAFEQQIADELRREIGPVPAIDAMDIARSVAAVSPGRWSVITRRMRGGVEPARAGRGITMFTAARIIGAAAIVALVGGFLALDLTSGPQDVPPPPAAVEPTVQPPSPFSGTISCSTWWQAGVETNVALEAVDGGNLVRRETRGFEGVFNVDEMSDPRLAGTYTVYTASDEYVYPGVDTEEPLWLEVGVTRIETDEGAWQGTGESVNVPGAREWYATHGTTVLTGEGAYEGLTAIWEEKLVEDECYCFVSMTGLEPCRWDVRGVILEGELPPLPAVPE